MKYPHENQAIPCVRVFLQVLQESASEMEVPDDCVLAGGEAMGIERRGAVGSYPVIPYPDGTSPSNWLQA